MKTDQLINAAAIAFAVYAVYLLTRGAGGTASAAPVILSTQPGQIARDYGAQEWMDSLTKQWADLYPAIPQANYDETDRLLKRYPAPVSAASSY